MCAYIYIDIYMYVCMNKSIYRYMCVYMNKYIHLYYYGYVCL